MTRPMYIRYMADYQDQPVTCPASRHVAQIAIEFSRKEINWAKTEPERCAMNMANTVRMLWHARETLSKLGWTWSEDEDGMVTWSERADADVDY